jgi:hypothetical protein
VKVPELNIHQLIDSNKFMENLIEEQKLKIAQMEAEMNELKNKLNVAGASNHDSATMTEMTLGELL